MNSGMLNANDLGTDRAMYQMPVAELYDMPLFHNDGGGLLQVDNFTDDNNRRMPETILPSSSHKIFCFT